jgi:hypothetical protein
MRDVVFDPGRASAPRVAVPHMLPSTLLTVSASASLWISWLNSTPHTITVYASQPPSPATTQHSLPGARYGLPGPVSHRQDHASFAWRTSNPRRGITTMDCFVASAPRSDGCASAISPHDLREVYRLTEDRRILLRPGANTHVCSASAGKMPCAAIGTGGPDSLSVAVPPIAQKCYAATLDGSGSLGVIEWNELSLCLV